MAQLTVSIDDFELSSKYTCTTTLYTAYSDESHTEEVSSFTRTETTTPTTSTASKTFNFTLPKGATVTSAKVNVANFSSPPFGASSVKINNTAVSISGAAAVDVTISNDATSVTVPFSFACNAVSHDHNALGNGTWGQSYWEGNTLCNPITYNHLSALSFGGVSLVIEYTPAVTFEGWTDDPLTAGETFIKAVHITEMQDIVSQLSESANNGTPTFTPAIAGETSLAQWLTQINEIRAVMDIVAPNHVEWIECPVNCPRADVMTQLRTVIVDAL